MGVSQARWLVYFMENPTKIRMMTGGTVAPILGNLPIKSSFFILFFGRVRFNLKLRHRLQDSPESRDLHHCFDESEVSAEKTLRYQLVAEASSIL